MSLLLQSLVTFAVVCASLLVNSNSHRNGDSGYKSEPCGHDPNSFDPPDESSTSREGRYEAGRSTGAILSWIFGQGARAATSRSKVFLAVALNSLHDLISRHDTRPIQATESRPPRGLA